jgi:hypothetical protein
MQPGAVLGLEGDVGQYVVLAAVHQYGEPGHRGRIWSATCRRGLRAASPQEARRIAAATTVGPSARALRHCASMHTAALPGAPRTRVTRAAVHHEHRDDELDALETALTKPFKKADQNGSARKGRMSPTISRLPSVVTATAIIAATERCGRRRGP